MFTNLMSEIRDFFIRTLDDSRSGINHRLRRLMERLQQHDPRLALRLRAQQLQPQYFAFRSVTTADRGAGRSGVPSEPDRNVGW